MAHYTVIKEDKHIYIDGVAAYDCDMGGLPSDLHALQWDGTNGHIEYTDVSKPNLTISSESEIETELGGSLSTLIERRTAALEASPFEETLPYDDDLN